MWLLDKFLKQRHYRKFIDLKIESNRKMKNLDYKKHHDHARSYMVVMRGVMDSLHTSNVLRNAADNSLAATDRDYIFRELMQFLTLGISHMPIEVKDEMLEYMHTNDNFQYLREKQSQRYDIVRNMVAKNNQK